MEKYINYNSTSELHKELVNIFLLCTEDRISDYYCYCNEKINSCDLCELVKFCLYEKMDGNSLKYFLKVNYNKRSKLEEFASKILPFFDKMKINDESCLVFLNKEYSWSMKDFSSGTTLYLSLEEVIDYEFINLHEHYTDDGRL